MSFNICCAISHIDIKKNQNIVILPLYKNNSTEVKDKSSHVTHFYSPLPPIMCEYYADGRIQKIITSNSTSHYKRIFDCDIKQFVDSLLCEESIFTSDMSCSPVKQYLVSDLPKEETLPPTTLFGFKKDPIFRSYTNLDFPNITLYVDRNGYKLTYGKSGKILILAHYHDFLKEFYELTDYYIHVKREHQKRVSLLNNLSYMIIDRSVYDYLIYMQNDKYREKVKNVMSLYRDLRKKTIPLVKNVSDPMKEYVFKDIMTTILNVFVGGNSASSEYYELLFQNRKNHLKSVLHNIVNLSLLCDSMYDLNMTFLPHNNKMHSEESATIQSVNKQIHYHNFILSELHKRVEKK